MVEVIMDSYKGSFYLVTGDLLFQRVKSALNQSHRRYFLLSKQVKSISAKLENIYYRLLTFFKMSPCDILEYIFKRQP